MRHETLGSMATGCGSEEMPSATRVSGCAKLENPILHPVCHQQVLSLQVDFRFATSRIRLLRACCFDQTDLFDCCSRLKLPEQFLNEYTRAPCGIADADRRLQASTAAVPCAKFHTHPPRPLSASAMPSFPPNSCQPARRTSAARDRGSAAARRVAQPLAPGPDTRRPEGQQQRRCQGR